MLFLLPRHSKIKYISLAVYNIFFLREVKLGTQFLDTRGIFLRSYHSKNYVEYSMCVKYMFQRKLELRTEMYDNWVVF